MIPERKEPQINTTLCFGEEQSAFVEKAVDQLSLSGRTIILDSGHQAYTRYCLRAMLDELARSSDRVKGDDPIKVRRVSQERDVIVSSLNSSVKDLELSSSHSRSAVSTREVWIFENTQSSSAEEAVFASNLIKQFKTAGISIIITGRSVGAGQENVERLAEQTKGMPFIFDLPELEESRELFQQAKLMGIGSEYAALMKEIGLPVEKNTNPAIVAFSEVAALDNDHTFDHDYQELVSPISESSELVGFNPLAKINKKFVYVAGCTVLSMVLASIPLVIDFDKSIEWFSGLTLPSISDWNQTSGEAQDTAEAKDLVANAESISEVADIDDLVIEPLLLPRISSRGDVVSNNIVAVDSDSMPNQLGRVENEVIADGGVSGLIVSSDLGPLVTTKPLTQTISVPPNDKQDLARSEEPASIIVDQWFVQHASFRVPQRAFLWKRNQRLDEELQVYSKGESNPRFVVVSGPFNSRDLARQYLAMNNMGNDKFFVKGDKLSDRIYP